MNIFFKKFGDYISNIMAFGMYIFIQQIILVPMLSGSLTESEFSKIILFMTVLNIVSIVIGTELGNTRILEDNNVSKDSIYNVLIIKIFSVSLPLSIFLYLFIYSDSLQFLLALLTCFLCSFKQYLSSYFRLENKFKYILYGNFFYGVGVILGVLLFIISGNPIFSFLIGELVTVIYLIFVSQKEKIWNINLRDSGDIKEKKIVYTSYLNLAMVSLLLNGLSYLDRFIIGPLLGLNVIAIYYSASAMSKFLSLLVNPINSVLIAKLAKQQKKYSYTTFFKFQIIILIGSCILSIVTSYLGVYFLYNQYFELAKSIILPVGIASGLSIASLISKTFVLVDVGTKGIININLLYGIVFFILAIVFSNIFGLQGFAWSSVIARAIQLLQYLILFSRKGNSDVYR